MFHKNRGFTLVELSIVLMISMMAISWGLWAKVNGIRQESAQVQGDALVTLANSVGTYETNHYTELVNGTAIAGFADIYHPTIPELITSGVLNNNFSTNNFYSSNYAIELSKVPAACVAPDCDIAFLVNLTGPIVDYRTGLVDGPTLGAAVRRIGANGGFSDRVSAATIKGVSGGWSAPNPVLNAGVPVPGILAVRGGYGSSGWAQFLRRDGTLPMTGGLDMGSNNINNAATLNSNAINNATSIATTTLATTAAVNVGGTLSVTGDTTLNSALGVAGVTTTNGVTNTGAISTTTLGTTAGATIGTTLNVAGATTTTGITNTGNITNVGLISNTGAITATGDLTASRYLPTTVVASGATCAGMDGWQARTAAGSLASCINGVWTTPDATTATLPCNGQTQSWSSCSANIPGPKVSGESTTVSAQWPSGATGSATFVCFSGVQVLQPGSTCTPPPCAAQGVSWGGCGASTGVVNDGASTTVSASTPSGASGSATYKCTAGSLALQSGSSCTLPPCSAQTMYWGGGCSAYFPSTPVGNTSSQSASTGTGSATYACNSPGGGSGWAYQSGSCTPPLASCSATYVTWAGAVTGCGGNTVPTASGVQVTVFNTVSTRTNTSAATAMCTNGSWGTAGLTCEPVVYPYYGSPIKWPGTTVAVGETFTAWDNYCISMGNVKRSTFASSYIMATGTKYALSYANASLCNMGNLAYCIISGAGNHGFAQMNCEK